MAATGWVRNLSVRVPWHDRAWDGHVCNDPIGNSACLALKLVAENRNDDLEQCLYGKSFDDLTPEQLPPCIRTSASFLSPHPQSFQSVMAYSKWSKDHQHILPRTVHVPACPFVDIIEHLKRQHDEQGVGELTTPRRQMDGTTGEAADKTPALARADVQLAAIFSGRELPPGEDEIVVKAMKGDDSDTVKYRQWETLKDLSALVESVITGELGCEQSEIIPAFEETLGAERNDKSYLNFGQGCADSAERWQILSVNRNTPGGSVFLNRRVKERLRDQRLKQAIDSNRVPQYKLWWRTIKPRGPEQITYGDKVICVRNHRRRPYIYNGGNGEPEFLANGEIGMVTG